MIKFKVSIFTYQNGRVDAPAFIIEAAKPGEAIQEARERSRLSDFPNWQFEAAKI